jgi:hypothetical protein
MALLDPILMIEAASATAWPEETKFVKVINVVGGAPTYDALSHTMTLNLVGAIDPASSGTYTLTGGADMALVHSYDVPTMTTGQGLVLGFRVTAKNSDNSAVGFAETTIPALQTSGGVLVLGDVDWSALLPYGWDVSVSPLVGSAGVGVSVMPGAVDGTVLVEIWHGDPITWELST